MSAVVLGISTLLQYVAAFLAARLIRITEHRTAWVLIASAILLMAVRRSITLFRILGRHELKPDLAAESVALAISILMVTGVARIAPLFLELKRSAMEIKKSQDHLQSILDHTPAAIYAKDLEGRYVLTNQFATNLVKKPVDALVGMADHEFLPKDIAHQVRQNDLQVLKECRPIEFDESIPSGDGELRHYLSVKFPLLDAERKPYGVCGISTDITDRIRAQEEHRRFEAQLQAAQKLESLGVLAGGVAHDFNNLLAVILSSIELAQDTPRIPEEVTKDLETAKAASFSAAALCKQLLAYSGRGQLRVSAVDLSDLVKRMTKLMEVSISKKAQLKAEYQDDLPLIEADASQIQQIVMNLITNASEALGNEAGTISVSTSLVTVSDEGLEDQRAGDPLKPGQYVCLEVADNGAGMDEQTQRRLFEPFFSTKATGRGLGLAAVAGIVRGHHGGVTLKSSPGEGTTFRMLLPLPDKPLKRAARPESPLPEVGRKGHILVVDDEALVRTVAQRSLERAGYQVQCAEDGEQAVKVFKERPERFDLVLLDLTMPTLDGEQTFALLREVHPSVRVLLMSGYDKAATKRGRFADALAGFVQKPYTSRQLVEAVEKALA